jgi:hypothetical protein
MLVNFLKKYTEFQKKSALLNALSVKEIAGRLPKSTVVHVIGSGNSVNVSQHYISNSEPCIGFNFSGLLDLNFSAYFCEALSDQRPAATELMHKISSGLACPVYARHLLHHTNSLKIARQLNLDLVKEFSPKSKHVNPVRVASHVANNNESFINAGSTVLPLIQLCRVAKIPNIVLHGIDLEGPYFFDDSSLSFKFKLHNLENDAGGYNKKFREDNDGINKKIQLDLITTLMILRKLLNSQGQELYIATPVGQLNAKLPAYYE